MAEPVGSEPGAETVVLDQAGSDSTATATRAVPWMPILVGLGALILVGLIIVIVLLVTRPGPSTALPAPIESPTASATPSAPPSPSATPTPTGVVAAPAQPAPANPAPAEPAPAEPAPPAKTPLTVGIVSFSAKSATTKTIAAECAAVQGKAATDDSWVLVRFTWVTKGMIEGGEIQVNGTYGGSSDLQGIGSNDSVLFDIKCFNTDGSVKSTDFTLLMSDGTQRYSRTITVSALGVTG